MLGTVKAISSLGFSAAVETFNGYSIFNFPIGSISIGDILFGPLHSCGGQIIHNKTTNKKIPVNITTIQAPLSDVLSLLAAPPYHKHPFQKSL